MPIGPRFIADLVEETERLVASGELSEPERAEAEAFLRDMHAQSSAERAVYDFFFSHMPDDDADISLIILKGHLLVEQRVREFVENRLLAPTALSTARLTSHQLICLAEAMCLPNPEPAWIWATARALNSLRNNLAHNLAPAGIQKKVESFLAAYQRRHPIHGGLVGCIGNLYAQVAGLAALALEPGYRIPRPRRP